MILEERKVDIIIKPYVHHMDQENQVLQSNKASDYLESKGVQGVFFNKDKKIPGQNFVMFDPKRLTILQRFDKRGKELK